jgi:putative endonuclease
VSFYVYILASGRNGTLYIGMTDDLARRIWMHREGVLPGFTKEHGIRTLVWYEQHETRDSAFARERAMKNWNRAWKIELIQKMNPEWQDLYETILS